MVESEEEGPESLGSVTVNDEGDGVSIELFTGQGWSTKVYLEDHAAWEILELLRGILKSRWVEGGDDANAEEEAGGHEGP